MMHALWTTAAVALTMLTVAGAAVAAGEHRENRRDSARVLWALTGGCALLAAGAITAAVVTA